MGKCHWIAEMCRNVVHPFAAQYDCVPPSLPPSFLLAFLFSFVCSSVPSFLPSFLHSFVFFVRFFVPSFVHGTFPMHGHGVMVYDGWTRVCGWYGRSRPQNQQLASSWSQLRFSILVGSSSNKLVPQFLPRIKIHIPFGSSAPTDGICNYGRVSFGAHGSGITRH